MEETKRKRGRPKKDDGRVCQVNVLLTREEMEALQRATEKSGKSQSYIVRKGVGFSLNMVKSDTNLDNFHFENGMFE